MRWEASQRTGAAIRKLRLAKGWTLAELSDQSGLPLSTLSRVELGQNALNFDKLARLCRALEVDLERLMTRQAEGSATTSGRRSVTRAGEGEPVVLGAASGLAGAPDLLSKAFSPSLLEVTAPTMAAHGPMALTEGEAYLLVLSGEIEVRTTLYAPLSMQGGDSVYFDGRPGFALLAPDGPARVLLVAAGEAAAEP